MSQNVSYTDNKKDAIEHAVHQLNESSDELIKVDAKDSSVQLFVTHEDSDIGKSITENGKKSGYKSHIPFFTKGKKYLVFSRISN